MSFTHYRTKAFVFKKSDFFEADKIFDVYTFDFGKLEIYARAIRKISSKLRGGVDVFCFSEIEFIQGKNYKTLTDAVLLKKFKNIRKEMGRLETAFEISEVLDNFLKFEEKDEKIWNLILWTFKKLDNLKLVFFRKKEEGFYIYYYFLWNFFSCLGYCPALYNCPVCQRKLKPLSLYFSLIDGGVICQSCFLSTKRKNVFKINPDFVKIMRVIVSDEWQIFSKLKIEKDLKDLLRNVSQKYYFYLLREQNRGDNLFNYFNI